MGFYEACVAENNKALVSDSLYFWAYLYKGWYLLELRDAVAALEATKQAEALEPASPFIGWSLGNIAFFRGDLSQAETEWRRVVQMNPSSRVDVVKAALALVAAYPAGRLLQDELREARAARNGAD